MALPAGRYGVTKNQLLKIKKLPMNTIKLIEELTEKFDLLGTAAFKNSTSVVTQSTDLVESGAVKDIVGWGNKNLLPNNAVSQTINGVTFTVKPDGSVSTSGTATSDWIIFDIDNLILKSGTYKFNGCNGGSVNTYRMTLSKTGSDVTTLYDGENEFTLEEDTEVTAKIIVRNANVNMNGKVFYPMISVNGGAYEPYHESVEEYCASKQLLKDTVGWIGDNQARLYNWTDSASNVTFTYIKNQVTLNGTCTGDISIPSSVAVPEDGKYTLKAGSYEIISDADNMSWQVVALNPVVVLTTDSKPFTIKEDKTVFARAVVKNGVTYNNQVVHVELRRQSVDTVKADNSVIGTVEDGATASQAYAVGEHFIRDGSFCTVTQAISQGGSFTLGTNYTAGDVAGALIPTKLESTSTAEQAASVSVPLSFHVAYVFVSLDSDRTMQCVIVKGITTRAIRFTYKASSAVEVRGYVWYDTNYSTITVGSFMVDNVEMKNDTNLKLEVFYI